MQIRNHVWEQKKTTRGQGMDKLENDNLHNHKWKRPTRNQRLPQS